MEVPNKENFIEVLTFLQNFCKLPRERFCTECPLYTTANVRGCELCTWPQSLDIDKIVECFYGKEN